MRIGEEPLVKASSEIATQFDTVMPEMALKVVW